MESENTKIAHVWCSFFEAACWEDAKSASAESEHSKLSSNDHCYHMPHTKFWIFTTVFAGF